MDLEAHFAAIWRHRWLVLAASVLVAGLVYIGTSALQAVYQADAQLSVTAGQAAAGQGVQGAVPFLATTYQSLAKTSPVLADAAKRSGLHITEETADARTSVQTNSATGFLNIAATGPSAEDATALAMAMSNALIAAVNSQQQQALNQDTAPIQSEIAQIENQLSSSSIGSTQQANLQTQYQALVQALDNRIAQAPNRLNVVSPAHAGSSPVAPTPKRNSLLAFITALVVFAELSVGYELVSDRLSKAPRDDEIRSLTGLPVLARIPKDPGSDMVEAFRILRTSLLFMNEEGKTHTIAVVGSESKVGKSLVSINLAGSFASLGVQAALVDADMRRPAIASRLGMSDSPGLSEALNGADGAAAFKGWKTQSRFKVSVMPAGAPVPDPAALLTGRWSEWASRRLSEFDTVIVDTPPGSMFPDSLIVASGCDAAIIVIDARSTKRRPLLGLIDHMRERGVHPQGVVVNQVTQATHVGRYYSRARRPYRERRFREGSRVKAAQDDERTGVVPGGYWDRTTTPSSTTPPSGHEITRPS